ncbi:MAG: hypothetical protein IT290_00435 [Deltaproteobacteria bacterium]|nr:hypothetical protein [Deltaproteobacteria bacterium]
MAIAIAMHAAVTREFRTDSEEERKLAQVLVEQLDMVRFTRSATAIIWSFLLMAAGALGAVAGTSGKFSEGVLFAAIPSVVLALVEWLWLRPHRARAVAAVISSRVNHRLTFDRVLRAASSVSGAGHLMDEFSQQTAYQPHVS